MKVMYILKNHLSKTSFGTYTDVFKYMEDTFVDPYSGNVKSGSAEPVNTAEWLKPNTTSAQLSFGERLVGITFNPSNDGDVSLIKTKMAEVANLINDQFQRNETSPLSKLIYEGAIHDILNAQMNAVKFVTLKY